MTSKYMIKLMFVMKIILIILEVQANDPTFFSSASTLLPTNLLLFQRDNKGINYICRCCELRIVKKCGETNGSEFCVAKKLLQCLFKDPMHPKDYPISLEALKIKCFSYCIRVFKFGSDHADCIVGCYEKNKKKPWISISRIDELQDL